MSFGAGFRFPFALALTLALATGACGDGDDDGHDLDVLPVASDAGPDGLEGFDLANDTSACQLQELAPALEGGNHTAACTQVEHTTNPPASGTHYGSWPLFRAYDKPVPWGYLLHGMEHGAVVIAYNCPDGCPADVAAAKAVMESVPRKSGCAKPRPPVIVTPDPTLAVRFAAASWGHVLRASCFDRTAFLGFVTAHVNMGPELFPGDCGAVDLEATGWCP